MPINTNIQVVNNPIPQVQTPRTAFKGTTAPDYTLDTVEIGGKKKTGLSNGAKAGIGVGILAAIGAAAALIRKGNVKEAVKLAEHIDFAEAKTLDEAIKWGKEHLGIKRYLNIDNLEVVNWINKGLVDVNNFMKGKAKMPSIVSSLKPTTEQDAQYIASVTRYIKDLKGHALNINKKVINDIDTVLNTRIKDLEEWKLIIKENENYKLGKIYSSNGATTEIEDLLNKFVNQSKQLSWADKIKLNESMNNLVTIKNNISDSPFKTIKQIFEFNKLKSITANGTKMTLEDIEKLDTKKQASILRGFIDKYYNVRFLIKKASPYNTIYHEMGHVQHQYSAGLDKYNKMGKLKELEEEGITDKSIINEFLNNPQKQQIASRVSTYAKESPLEFVAETFAEMVNGNKLSDEVKALYKEFKGPAVN